MVSRVLIPKLFEAILFSRPARRSKRALLWPRMAEYLSNGLFVSPPPCRTSRISGARLPRIFPDTQCLKGRQPLLPHELLNYAQKPPHASVMQTLSRSEFSISDDAPLLRAFAKQSIGFATPKGMVDCTRHSYLLVPDAARRLRRSVRSRMPKTSLALARRRSAATRWSGMSALHSIALRSGGGGLL